MVKKSLCPLTPKPLLQSQKFRHILPRNWEIYIFVSYDFCRISNSSPVTGTLPPLPVLGGEKFLPSSGQTVGPIRIILTHSRLQIARSTTLLLDTFAVPITVADLQDHNFSSFSHFPFYRRNPWSNPIAFQVSIFQNCGIYNFSSRNVCRMSNGCRITR